MESLSMIAGIEDSFRRIQLLGTEPICFAVQMEPHYCHHSVQLAHSQKINVIKGYRDIC